MQEKNTKKILVSGSLRMKDTRSGSNNPIPSYGSMAFVSVAISLKKMETEFMVNSWLWQVIDLVCILFLRLFYYLLTQNENSSTIIEDIKATVQAQPDIGLSFFYFDIEDKAKQTTRSLLSSLALTLTGKSKNSHFMESLYGKYIGLHSPTEDELLELFMELLKGFKQAYIIIDALDECDDYHQLFHVIRIIHDWQILPVHLLVSSRREQDIIVAMKEHITAEIKISAKLVENDIISYVQSAVRDYRLRRWGPTAQEHVKEKLINGANGMYVYIYYSIVYEANQLLCRFRWVACQIEELKKCPNTKVLMESLECLPKDLEATYDQVLQRMDEYIMPCAKLLLLWLVLAMRPLRLEELAIVATFNPSGGEYDSNLALSHPDDVIQVCSSLVTKDDKGTVQLAHASVKEYFLAKPRVWKKENVALCDTEAGHGMIAHGCLKYLLQEDGWHQDKKFVNLPLCQYAVQFWPDHYRLSNRNATLHDIVMAFFHMKNEAFQTWIEMQDLAFLIHLRYHTNSAVHIAAALGLHDVIKDLTMNNAQSLEYSTAVQIAASKGYTDIVQFFIEKGVDVNIQGGYYGNALQAASFNGEADVVKLLLDMGADINAQGGRYGNAMQAASFNGQTQIVGLLLDKGADINAQSGHYGNAIQAASFNGQTETVKLLLAMGANINVEGGYYNNAMQAASFNGQTEVVKLLLDNGIDIDAQAGYYGNALQAASFNGQVEIVRLLLDKGADINAQCGHYGNAMQAASFNGQTHIVKLLLDKGADMNAHGGRYDHAMQAASFKGQDEVVKLFLDRGADVNGQGGHFGNAMQAASFNGQTHIVKLLLDNGADINTQCGHYGHALQAASFNGQDEVVKLLLDKKVDVNGQGGFYGNAMQAASFNGQTHIVKLLLDKGADINAQCGHYGHAMQAASFKGQDEVVKLLLDNGVDVNSQGGYYGNAVQAASFNGQTHIVKLLLDRGADINAQCGHYGHAIQAASFKGQAEIVKLLLDKGVDVNGQNGYYGNAMQAASFNGQTHIVKLLLDRGADINAQCGHYGNAMQAASFNGQAEVVEFLSENGAVGGTKESNIYCN